MPPVAPLTAAATPALFGLPVPTGNCRSLALPSVQSVGAAALRNDVKTAVVPDGSERLNTLTDVLGSDTPGLSFLTAAASQVLILPEKICAIVAADSCSELTPDRLYVTPTPPAVTGMWIAVLPQRELAFDCSSGFIVTSEPAKSTWLAPKFWIPVPEPTAL